MEFLWFLIIGGIAGWIAGLLMKGGGFGIAGNVVVGVIGAILGGYLIRAFGWTAYGITGSLIMAVIGAVILLFIVNLVGRQRRLH